MTKGRERNQSNTSSIVAGQLSKASSRGKIEAITEKLSLHLSFLLAEQIWPWLHCCERKNLNSRDHTLLNDGKLFFIQNRGKPQNLNSTEKNLDSRRKENENLSFFFLSLSIPSLFFCLVFLECVCVCGDVVEGEFHIK